MSGFMDILEELLTSDKDNEAPKKPEQATPPPKPAAPAPPPQSAQPWYPVPVQADAKDTYAPPAGWQVPGQAPAAPAPGAPMQAPAPDSYAAPQGWSVAGQVGDDRNAALNASLQGALAQRFGR